MTESQMQDTEKEKTIEEAFQELEALAQKLEDSEYFTGRLFSFL